MHSLSNVTVSEFWDELEKIAKIPRVRMNASNVNRARLVGIVKKGPGPGQSRERSVLRWKAIDSDLKVRRAKAKRTGWQATMAKIRDAAA